MSMRRIAPASLDALVAAAQAAPRRRCNLNIHGTEAAPAQRLFNAVEPGSYIPPHRHADPNKDETFLWVRGRFGVIEFENDGTIAGSAVLAPDTSLAVTIPAGRFHTIFALEPHSIFFESKAGPYRPLDPSERATWAPPEGSPDGADYLKRLRSALPETADRKDKR
jgi:cupin fold WbuC family metalloprotein